MVGEREILVTGGAGYIGCCLVRRLLARGYKVRVLDALLFGSRGIDEFMNHPHFTFLQGDVRHIEDLAQAVKGVDSVVHLAAIVGDPACQVNEDATMTVNCEATKALVEICNHYGVERLIFASSCSVYGACKDLTLNEGSFLNPVSLYAKTRITSEKIILERAEDGVVPTIVRLGTAYGYSRRMRFDLVVNILTVKAIMEGTMTVYHGEVWRPLIHVEDAAQAYVVLLEAPQEKIDREIFNVGSNEQNYQMGKVGKIVEETVPGSKLLFVNETEDNRNYRVCFDKIRYHLGYTTEKTVRDAVLEIEAKLKDGTVKDYKSDIYYNVRYKEYR